MAQDALGSAQGADAEARKLLDSAQRHWAQAAQVKVAPSLGSAQGPKGGTIAGFCTWALGTGCSGTEVAAKSTTTGFCAGALCVGCSCTLVAGKGGGTGFCAGALGTGC